MQQQMQQRMQQQMQQQMQMAAMMQMQMGAAAQMQQMQMAAMMPMMQMGMPMAAMMPMMQMEAPGKAEGDDEEQITSCSPEEIAALELEVKESEKAAKATAKSSGSYVGLMARYIEDEGFGFISCAECKDVWDKTDIFVSGRNFVTSGIDVGDIVTFQVEKDGKDLPRAVNPKTLSDLTRMKKKLSKMREVAKNTNMLKRGAPEDGMLLMPDLKRMNPGINMGAG
mmetsp:Transcript_74967/g.232663  ORF Transcript_74967/g.232663 Transcript_74967/m.232663 type:complete len:225 (-) Transcript_74967:571-1245(-)